MRDLTINLQDILTLIHSAEVQGLDNELIFGGFVQWIGQLSISDQEIEEYARGFLTPEMLRAGYGLDDYEGARTILQAFRAKWLA
jgi:hypothetical protein